MSDDTPAAWDRQPGEPELWFERFQHYLALGSDRSLGACWAQHRSARTRLGEVPAVWYDAADDWCWRARAEAYDLDQARQVRDRLLAPPEATP